MSSSFICPVSPAPRGAWDAEGRHVFKGKGQNWASKPHDKHNDELNTGERSDVSNTINFFKLAYLELGGNIIDNYTYVGKRHSHLQILYYVNLTMEILTLISTNFIMQM